MKTSFIIGKINTVADEIPQVATRLNYKDYWGAIKVRWGIKRESFSVEPGLYAVGNPNETSDVLVTANYKLSFDHVRKNLEGFNAWILVLDTKGVNVWCAAGKGTFSTKELVHRIKSTSLDRIVSHRRLILPQLGATGVSAHEVKSLTSSTNAPSKVENSTFNPESLKNIGMGIKTNPGFNVNYGPIRASDLKTFLANGYKANPEMRKMKFEFTDRIKLIPNDFMYGKKYFAYAFVALAIISTIGKWNLPFSEIIKLGIVAFTNLFTGYISGIVFTPMLLPALPFKRFALKGFAISIVASTALLFFNMLGNNILEITSWYLINGAVASFMAMNFTGSSTYTSLSGVKVEMKVAVPVQISFAALGLVLLVVGKLI